RLASSTRASSSPRTAPVEVARRRMPSNGVPMTGDVQGLNAAVLHEWAPRERAPLHAAFVFVRRNPLGTMCAVILLVIALVAVFAGQLAPYGPNTTHLTDQLRSPGGKYLLGTDNLGRDLLSRLIYGA